MSQFTEIGATSGFIGTGTSLPIAYISKTGNTLLVGVLIQHEANSVSGIADSAGLDSTGLPINTWVQIATVNLSGGGKLEVWEARNALSISSITITGSASDEYQAIIGEFSGLGNVTFNYTNSNAAAASLTIDETSTDAGVCFIGFFACAGAPITSFTFGTDILRVNNSGFMGLGLTSNTITKLKANWGGSNAVLGIGMTFNVGISFDHIPGFSDLTDATLAAEELSLGRKVAAISENAAFGMVRIECFSGYFKNGDTVPIPSSPVDGYIYSRNELIYIWGIRDTVSQTSGTGWASGKDSIWYLAAKVDQDTGAVSTSIGYRRSGSNWTPTVSDDGLLYVVTVAQRLKTALTLAAVPSYVETDDTIYTQDAAVTQSMLQSLNDNAKSAIVKTEVIDMGEFINGQTVPQPVSPADGYKYDYSRVAFGFSWRWTGTNSVFTQPGKSIGQQAQMKASISSVGVVSCSVSFVDDGGSLTNRTTYGRIRVFAICNRSRLSSITLPANCKPWDASIGTNPSWGSLYNGAAPIQVPVVAGLTIIVRCTGSAEFGGPPAWNANGDRATWLTHPATDWPNNFSTTSLLGVIGTMGAFVDAAGNVIVIAGVKQIFELGVGPKTITVPAGAKFLNLGTIDLSNAYNDNTGSFQVLISFSSSGTLYNDFLELDTNQFMPGNFLPASTMKQIDHNTKEAIMATEIFGPTTHANGDVIALPTGADGYTYTRAEVQYLWEWSDTTDQTGSNLREVAFYGRIDPTTGKVVLQVWRLPPGGPAESDNDTLCRINVIMIAHRQRSLATSFTTDPVPPTDIATTKTDTNTITTINGV